MSDADLLRPFAALRYMRFEARNSCAAIPSCMLAHLAALAASIALQEALLATEGIYGGSGEIRSTRLSVFVESTLGASSTTMSKGAIVLPDLALKSSVMRRRANDRGRSDAYKSALEYSLSEE